MGNLNDPPDFSGQRVKSGMPPHSRPTGQSGEDKADSNESDSLTASGDDPLTSLDADLLGRREFAERVYQLLTDRKPAWPVRVALRGGWGSGKTSVANFVEKIAKKNHVFVKYPVSLQSTSEELLLGFALALYDAIKAKGLPVAKELKSRLENANILQNVGKHNLTKAVDGFTQKAASLAPWGELAVGGLKSAFSAGFAWAQAKLGVDEEMVKNIIKDLHGQRVIVIFDDLDRADPHVIPQLLLRLRDLLQLSGFSFLVPFDREAVVLNLESQYTGNGQGIRFLEKIFDYQIDLPPPSTSQRLKLLTVHIAYHVPQMPVRIINSLRDVLPETPRRLKSLVRHLYMYRDFDNSSDTALIAWWSILCYEMMQHSSPEVLELIREELRHSAGWAASLPQRVSAFPAVELMWLAKRPEVCLKVTEAVNLSKMRFGIVIYELWLQVAAALEISAKSDSSMPEPKSEAVRRAVAIAMSWRVANGEVIIEDVFDVKRVLRIATGSTEGKDLNAFNLHIVSYAENMLDQIGALRNVGSAGVSSRISRAMGELSRSLTEIFKKLPIFVSIPFRNEDLNWDRYDAVRVTFELALRAACAGDLPEEVREAALDTMKAVAEKAEDDTGELFQLLDELGSDNAEWSAVIEAVIYPKLAGRIVSELCQWLDRDSSKDFDYHLPKPRIYRAFLFRKDLGLWQNPEWRGRLFDGEGRDGLAFNAYSVLAECAYTDDEELARKLASDVDIIEELWKTMVRENPNGLKSLRRALVDRGVRTDALLIVDKAQPVGDH